MHYGLFPSVCSGSCVVMGDLRLVEVSESAILTFNHLRAASAELLTTAGGFESKDRGFTNP